MPYKNPEFNLLLLLLWYL